MAGKKKVEKESSSWIGGIEKYSRQIWLAGLGAYSKISNDGTKLFDTLVKDGEHAEAQAKTEVDKQVDTVKSSAKSARSRVGDVKDKALGKWSELEEAFDTRLNSAISRLGVPSRNEVKALHSKVDTLTRQLEKLTGESVRTPAAKPATKAAAANGAVKPTTKTANGAAKPPAKAASASKPSTRTAANGAKPAAKAPAKAARKPAAKTADAKPASKAQAEAKAKTAAVKPAAKAPAAKPVAAAKTAAAKTTAAAKATAAKTTASGKAAVPKTAAAKPAAKAKSAVKPAVKKPDPAKAETTPAAAASTLPSTPPATASASATPSTQS